MVFLILIIRIYSFLQANVWFSRPVHSSALPPLRRIGDIPEHARLSTGVVYSAKLFSDNLSHRLVARTIAWLVILPTGGRYLTNRSPDIEFGGFL